MASSNEIQRNDLRLRILEVGFGVPRCSIMYAISLCLFVVVLSCKPASAGTETFHLSLPNIESGFERVLGVGVALPHPYFQRPKYRYPVYDREGRGSLLYGYGGDEVYPYRVFDPVEGHHKK